MNNSNKKKMKKLLLILALTVGIFTASARDSYSRNVTDLPSAAQVVLKNSFKAKVSHIKIEKELGRVSEYDVVLTDGSEITFDKSGNWKEVEVRAAASVPDAFVPAAIRTYVKQNQKNTRIIGIEKKRNGYEVELSNGVEMKFDSAGKFLRYDD